MMGLTRGWAIQYEGIDGLSECWRVGVVLGSKFL